MTLRSKYSLPFNKISVENFIESLLYDVIFLQPNPRFTLEEIKTQFLNILLTIVPDKKAQHIQKDFFEALPYIKKELDDLIFTFYAQDPASKSEIEIILSYPGFYAIAIHRLAHQLYVWDTPILPRFFC